jgi:hypothetical protein
LEAVLSVETEKSKDCNVLGKNQWLSKDGDNRNRQNRGHWYGRTIEKLGDYLDLTYVDVYHTANEFRWNGQENYGALKWKRTLKRDTLRNKFSVIDLLLSDSHKVY